MLPIKVKRFCQKIGAAMSLAVAHIRVNDELTDLVPMFILLPKVGAVEENSNSRVLELALGQAVVIEYPFLGKGYFVMLEPLKDAAKPSMGSKTSKIGQAIRCTHIPIIPESSGISNSKGSVL